jgi:formate dehydrogenase maturation protein FdhE
MSNKREVEVTVNKHGRNWINHERPPYCPECDGKSIKHSISIIHSGKEKKYVAECLCLDCGCEFTLVRIEVEEDETDK